MGNTFTDAQAATGATRLVSLDDVKTYLGVTADTDNTLIGQMIDAAQEAMEKYAGRHFLNATVTEYLNGTGKRTLFLQEPPDGGDSGVTSIYVDSARAWAAANLIDSDDYQVDSGDCCVHYLDHIWTMGQRNVRVIYTAGFATVPDDLEFACRIQVAALYSAWGMAKQAKDILESESVEGWTQKFLKRKGLMVEVGEICDRYVPARL